MCVMSMVMDHYQPIIPVWPPQQPFPFGPGPVPQPPQQVVPVAGAFIPVTYFVPLTSPEELAELRKLIAEFKEAVKAAATVDRLTGQKDCVDPEKAKLEVRVAELERRLNAMGTAASGSD